MLACDTLDRKPPPACFFAQSTGRHRSVRIRQRRSYIEA
jgi:hypothetical protein